MKSGAISHIKFKKLKRLLGLPSYVVVGILESVWMLTAECADDGAIGRFSDDDIASYLEWEGDAGQLIEHLVTAGFLDRDDQFRLVVHDWEDHQPYYVTKRIHKRNERNKGVTSRKVATRSDVSPENGDKVGRVASKNATVPSNPTQPNPTQPSSSADAEDDGVEKPDRDLLFDAICEITQSDPQVSGGHVAKVATLLRNATPPYEPDDVLSKLPKALAKLSWFKGDITVGMVEKYIGQVRAKSRPPPVDDSIPKASQEDVRAACDIVFGKKSNADTGQGRTEKRPPPAARTTPPGGRGHPS